MQYFLLCALLLGLHQTLTPMALTTTKTNDYIDENNNYLPPHRAVISEQNYWYLFTATRAITNPRTAKKSPIIISIYSQNPRIPWATIVDIITSQYFDGSLCRNLLDSFYRRYACARKSTFIEINNSDDMTNQVITMDTTDVNMSVQPSTKLPVDFCANILYKPSAHSKIHPDSITGIITERLKQQKNFIPDLQNIAYKNSDYESYVIIRIQSKSRKEQQEKFKSPVFDEVYYVPFASLQKPCFGKNIELSMGELNNNIVRKAFESFYDNIIRANSFREIKIFMIGFAMKYLGKPNDFCTITAKDGNQISWQQLLTFDQEGKIQIALD